MNNNQKKVVKYYNNLESKFGFNLFLWGSKHFGFYPKGEKGMTEKKAQIILQDLVAKKLDLRKNQKVLDAGCGQGVVSTYLAKNYGVEVSGITLVPFESRSAQRMAKELKVEDRTNYQIMDYSSTNFDDNYFDAIYTTETLSHSPDINKTLKELFRILKPGGIFAFFEYTIAEDQRFSKQERKMLDLVADGSAMMGLKSFRHDNFAKVIESAGFENVREKNISENILPSFRRLYKFSIIPYAVIRILGLQRLFVNMTAAYEYYKMAEKDLIRYIVFTGKKPL